MAVLVAQAVALMIVVVEAAVHLQQAQMLLPLTVAMAVTAQHHQFLVLLLLTLAAVVGVVERQAHPEQVVLVVAGTDHHQMP